MPIVSDMQLTLNAEAVERAMEVQRENQSLKGRVAELEAERDVAVELASRLEADVESLNQTDTELTAKVVDLQAQLDRAKTIIDDVIDAWHENSGDTRGLHGALGMTVAEYNQYFAHGLAGRATEPRADGVERSMDSFPVGEHRYAEWFLPSGTSAGWWVTHWEEPCGGEKGRWLPATKCATHIAMEPRHWTEFIGSATEPRADGIRYVAATECDVYPENDHHYIAKWTPDGPETLTEMEQAFAVAALNSMGEPDKPRPMSEAPRDGTDILGQMRNGERRICCWAWSVSMWVPSEPLGWWPRAEMAKQAKAACSGLPTSSGGEDSNNES